MNRQRHIAVVRRAGVLAVVALALASCGQRSETPASPFHSVDISAVEWGRDFQLTDHKGEPRSLTDFREKVVMMFFGFTNCPDVCPTTMADMAQVIGRLGKEGERVQGLLVTVDPARDTPEVLGRYVTAFHPHSWAFEVTTRRRRNWLGNSGLSTQPASLKPDTLTTTTWWITPVRSMSSTAAESCGYS